MRARSLHSVVLILLLGGGVAVASVAGGSLWAWPPAQEQGNEQQQPSDPSYRVGVYKVPIVVLPVEVANLYNQLVMGLKAENFQVFEDDVEQKISICKADDRSTSIAILLDHSESMERMVPAALAAAKEIVNRSSPTNEFFIIAFAREARLLTSFSRSRNEVGTISLPENKKPGSVLLDAMYLGLKELEKAANERRILLLISDGGENRSQHREGEIREILKRGDVQFYAIGMYEPLGYRNRSAEELNGPSLLVEMARLTGGRAFPVENAQDAAAVVEHITLGLQNNYVLGYYSTNQQKDGKWRKIRVKLRSLPKGIHGSVFARSGYYAPQK